MQSGLDVSSCFLEGLSLGDLRRVVGADPYHVSAEEDHHVGTDLKTNSQTQCLAQNWENRDTTEEPHQV